MRVHPVWNIAQRQAVADPQTKPTDLGSESIAYIHHRHLLLLSPKAVLLIYGGWKAEST